MTVDRYQKACRPHARESPLELLIRIAEADARSSVTKRRWGTLGFCLSLLPQMNILALGIAVLAASILIPRMDLSISERVEIYSQHPALYTLHYRKTAKTVRSLSIVCGWILGGICIVFFF